MIDMTRLNRRISDNPFLRFKMVMVWLLTLVGSFLSGVWLASPSLTELQRILINVGTALIGVSVAVWGLYWQGIRATIENQQQVLESQEKVIESLEQKCSSLEMQIGVLNGQIEGLRKQYEAVIAANLKLQGIEAPT